jgi:hypothetical protein
MGTDNDRAMFMFKVLGIVLVAVVVVEPRRISRGRFTSRNDMVYLLYRIRFCVSCFV